MTIKKQIYSGVPGGYDVLVLADLVRRHQSLFHVAAAEAHLQQMKEALAVMAPDVSVWDFPAWDTVPYDRVSPHPDIEGARLETLSKLANTGAFQKPTVILTSVNAVLQKVPPKDFFKGHFLDARVGGSFDWNRVQDFLNENGYTRTEQVMEPGEYAVRGGIVDLFPAGAEHPMRLDLFGDELESIRTFDPISQKTIGQVDSFSLKPMAEFILTPDSIARFRTKYRDLFGTTDDLLYESVSHGRKMAGIEHWLPLFFEKMSSVLSYQPDVPVSLDFGADKAVEDRWAQIKEYYEARLASLENKADMGLVYRPVPPDLFFWDEKAWASLLEDRAVVQFSPFVEPDSKDMGGRVGENFAASRESQDVFDKLADYIVKTKEHVVIGAYSSVSADRIAGILKEKGVPVTVVSSWPAAVKKTPSVMVLPLEKGFKSKDITLFTESDLLGEKVGRPTKYRKSKENFIEDISSLSEGDLVVHVSHGIGRYEGLVTLSVGGVAHDCLKIVYADDDKLFVPVENLDMLSRYGSENTHVALDKLGGGAWEARKSRIKKRLLDMAEKLIAVAAARFAKKTEKIYPPAGVYNEFCARFPYVETQDQLKSINQVMADFEKGCPMDRLICGDVGFGKTEVALRAAFIAAMNGEQVALVVPTTLLARQHYETFAKRFKGFPLKIGRLSRLVSAKEAGETKKGLADGSIDIVIGTHALLSKNLSFKNLGLLIVDEEQHFGVAHKERLKELKSDVHVLTLTATPIPRTLQMSLTGVRDLSVIATPPVDRMAVSTFVMPFDPVIIRDAIMREHLRGGQTFYVCPRISDMAPLLERLHKIVPEVKIVSAHGQMSPSQLEKIMNDFADGKYDVLLATSIIESGLDMPSVNTMIVHKADMFGLAALYQLRGRVGRSKVKAYAYLTTVEHKKLTPTATRRLSVMQSLDSLGAGFTLASHDLDIRGAGNLLGQEQSGHIKEVGVELYQKMLEEAVATLKAGTGAEELQAQENWSPQISLGLSVLIPESYVPDLGLRMELYHRLANIEDEAELDEMRLELQDRFGPIPQEVQNLFEIVQIKALCRAAFVEKLDAGPKGLTISFHNNLYPNPAGLVGFINGQMGLAKLKPDKLTVTRAWDRMEDRVNGVKRILETLARLAQE